MKITATIITLNEERNIARAIESLRCCDEILVLDSGSTDRTVELAEKLGARMIESRLARLRRPEELGRGAGGARLDSFARRRRGAERGAGRRDLEPEEDRARSYDAYTMPRLAQYLGRWILHSGWYPDRKVRLYDRRKAKWVGDFVHESVQVHGPRRPPGGNILHFTCDSLSEHLKTMDRYTTLAAEELAAAQGQVSTLRHLISRSGVDLRAHVFPAARFSGRPGRTDHRLHGGASTRF